MDCLACEALTYKAGTSNATACSPQPTCGAGEFISPDSTTSRVVCQPCPTGTFRSDVTHRQAACAAWTECTREGQIEAVPPTAVVDRVCGSEGECFEDEWESKAPTDTSPRQCMRLSLCGQGQRAMKAPSSSADLTCAPCVPGTFQTSSSHRVAACPPLPSLLCPEGQRPSNASTMVAQVCVLCLAGESCNPSAAVKQGADSDAGSDSVVVIVVVVLLIFLLACVVLAVILKKKQTGSKSMIPVHSAYANPCYNISAASSGGGAIVRGSRTSVVVKPENNSTLYDIPMDMTSSTTDGDDDGDTYEAMNIVGSGRSIDLTYGGDAYDTNTADTYGGDAYDTNTAAVYGDDAYATVPDKHSDSLYAIPYGNPNEGIEVAADASTSYSGYDAANEGVDVADVASTSYSGYDDAASPNAEDYGQEAETDQPEGYLEVDGTATTPATPAAVAAVDVYGANERTIGICGYSGVRLVASYLFYAPAWSHTICVNVFVFWLEVLPIITACTMMFA